MFPLQSRIRFTSLSVLPQATAGVSSQQGFRAAAVDVSALVEAAQKMATAVQKSHSQGRHGQTDRDSYNELNKR